MDAYTIEREFDKNWNICSETNDKISNTSIKSLIQFSMKMIGKITWLNNKITLKRRVILFCFGEKCMSGRIEKLKESINDNEFEILVDFIEPDYFKDELIIGDFFTINEASKILTKGEVIGLVRS